MNGRKLVVKEDFDNDRDKFGRIIRGNSGRNNDSRDRGTGRGSLNRSSEQHNSRRVGDLGETFGLSPQFLESLGIDGPLHTRIFVANVRLFLPFSTKKRKFTFDRN